MEPIFQPIGCNECRDKERLGIDFSMAFQPIIDISSRQIYGFEALVRGIKGEGAYSVLSQINEDNRYVFDQSIRVKALDLASRLNLPGKLSINFLPNAVYKAETCIRATLEAARQLDFPTERIMFEVTEGERVIDHGHLKSIFHEYKKHSFTTAIDDFGAGYSGLNLLADWQPDVIKLDMALTRNIDSDKVRRALVSGILGLCGELGIDVIAEGIETREECLALADQGVRLFQGYFFARPAFEALPQIPPDVWTSLSS